MTSIQRKSYTDHLGHALRVGDYVAATTKKTGMFVGRINKINAVKLRVEFTYYSTTRNTVMRAVMPDQTVKLDADTALLYMLSH